MFTGVATLAPTNALAHHQHGCGRRGEDRGLNNSSLREGLRPFLFPAERCLSFSLAREAPPARQGWWVISVPTTLDGGRVRSTPSGGCLSAPGSPCCVLRCPPALRAQCRVLRCPTSAPARAAGSQVPHQPTRARIGNESIRFFRLIRGGYALRDAGASITLSLRCAASWFGERGRRLRPLPKGVLEVSARHGYFAPSQTIMDYAHVCSPRMEDHCCDLGKRPLNWGYPVVEVRGFEPLASSVRGKRSAGLSYTPESTDCTAWGRRNRPAITRRRAIAAAAPAPPL